MKPRMSLTFLDNSVEASSTGEDYSDLEYDKLVSLVIHHDEDIRSDGYRAFLGMECSLKVEVMRKLHRQYWHIGSEQALRHFSPVLNTPGARGEFRRNWDQVVAECGVCRSRSKPAPHPRRGIVPSSPNQFIGIDVFECVVLGKKRQIVHIVDYLSRYSLLWSPPEVVEGRACITGVHVLRALLEWKHLFGRDPQFVVCDNGTEFSNDVLASYAEVNGIEFLFSPAYVYSSHGMVERHNAICQAILEKIQQEWPLDQTSTLTAREVLLMACVAKNNNIMACGWSSAAICFGTMHYYGDIARDCIRFSEEVDVDDLARKHVLQRMNLQHRAAQAQQACKLSEEFRKMLQERLRGNQGIPLAVGDAIEVYEVKKKRWRPAVLCYEKGNKTVKVEFPDGKTADHHRKNCRKAIPPEHRNVDLRARIAQEEIIQSIDGVKIEGIEACPRVSGPARSFPAKVTDSDDASAVDDVDSAANADVDMDVAVGADGDIEGDAGIDDSDVDGDAVASTSEVDMDVSRPAEGKGNSAPEVQSKRGKGKRGRKNRTVDVGLLNPKHYKPVPLGLQNREGLSQLSVSQLRWLTKKYDLPLKNGSLPLRKQLEEFFVSDGMVDEVLLSGDALFAFQRLGGSSKSDFPEDDWPELGEDEKVVAALLARSELSPKEAKAHLEFFKAMDKELAAIVDVENVLRIVPRSVVKPTDTVLTTRWVYTLKEAPEGGSMLKARLVARGFEETSVHKLEAESPTTRRWSVKLITSLAMVMGFPLLCVDVRTAFLQSDVPEHLQDTIFLEPPPYAGLAVDEIFERLPNKSLYGERRAPRRWYETIHRYMVSKGFQQEPTDCCLYFKKTPYGVCALRVDDLIAMGDKQFLQEILGVKFKLGKAQLNRFKYLGSSVDCQRDVLTISQSEYYEKLRPLDFKRKLKCESIPLNKQEEKAVRASVGMLLWLGIQSRPDIMYSVLQAASNVKTERGAFYVNKIVRMLQKTGEIKTIYRKFWRTDVINLVLYIDSGLGKEEGAKSQLGYMVLVAAAADGSDPHAIHLESSLVAHIVHYVSRTQRRVAHNSFAAESFASVSGNDLHLAIASQLAAFTDVSICLHYITDCMSLLTAILSTNPKVEELKLLPTVMKIREQLAEKDQRLYHTPGNKNPTVPLTKCLSRCASTMIILRKIMETGAIDGTLLSPLPRKLASNLK